MKVAFWYHFGVYCRWQLGKGGGRLLAIFGAYCRWQVGKGDSHHLRMKAKTWKR